MHDVFLDGNRMKQSIVPADFNITETDLFRCDD